MSSIAKFKYLLTTQQKRQLIVLAVLLLIGMLFEMLGLSILLPALGLMLKSDIATSYPALAPVIRFLGNPSRLQMVLYGMSILVTVYLLKTVYLIFLGWRQSKFTSDLTAGLSEKLFLGYLRQPYTFHLQRNSAELLRNIQTEIGQFTTVSQSVVTLASELSVITGIAFLLILTEPVGAMAVTVFLGGTAYLFHRMTRNKLLRWGQERVYHAGYTNQHLLQGLGGVKDVKLLGKEDRFLSEYKIHNRKYANLQLKTLTLSLAPRFYLELFAVFGLSGLIVAMVLQNKPLDMLIPTIGIFVAAAFRMIPSMNRIMSSMQVVRYTQSTLNVLYNEFVTIEQHAAAKEQDNPIAFNEVLEARDIVFYYPNTQTPSVNGVSIRVKKGSCVGFIGPSGSGKSTMVDILLGLMKPGSGSLTIDGKPMDGSVRSWQKKVGYVPQSIYLIDDSLRRNIAFGLADDQIDEEAVIRAIRMAHLEEFVNSLPEKLDTFVGERGVRLSGGQRQRIGIARAVYHDPEVLVLDEATSALDMGTESGVMKAVDALHGKKTLIIVAHRLSTVAGCDWLYKLDKGKVVREGPPSELLMTSEIVNP